MKGELMSEFTAHIRGTSFWQPRLGGHRRMLKEVGAEAGTATRREGLVAVVAVAKDESRGGHVHEGNSTSARSNESCNVARGKKTHA